MNYNKIFNLRKFLSSPRKLFFVLIFSLISFFIHHFLNLNPSFDALVTRVIDGDTIEVYTTKTIRVRLYGLDAPELKQEFGPIAKNELTRLILNKKVKLIYKNTDKYNRKVAIVKLNNKDINAYLVEHGFAWAYYGDLYKNKQAEARKFKRGLWSSEKPLEPSKWRKRNSL